MLRVGAGAEASTRRGCLGQVRDAYAACARAYVRAFSGHVLSELEGVVHNKLLGRARMSPGTRDGTRLVLVGPSWVAKAHSPLPYLPPSGSQDARIVGQSLYGYLVTAKFEKAHLAMCFTSFKKVSSRVGRSRNADNNLIRINAATTLIVGQT